MPDLASLAAHQQYLLLAQQQQNYLEQQKQIYSQQQVVQQVSPISSSIVCVFRDFSKKCSKKYFK